MTHDSVLLVRVNLSEQSGLFFASSPDVAGLNICGKTMEQTCASAVKAIKMLFKHNRGLDVQVMPATEDDDNFPVITGKCEQFAVQRLAA